jgi:hypothetical protein
MRVVVSLSVALLLSVAAPVFASQAAGGKSAAKAPAGPVNVNTASEAELVALPGIGPATAKKIIAGRPYASVSDLSKAGVSKSTMDKIASMVTVGSGAAAAAPAPSRPAPPATPPPAISAPSSSTPTSTRTASAPATAQQPPAPGMVWVNLETKVFHREGDRYYGNTKHGKFMTEADAVKAGYHEAKTRKKSGGGH